MKRHNSKTRNSEISNTNYVSATCRPRLNRKCKLLDEDKPDKKTEPLLITKEKTLANVKLLPIKKKRKTAVLDLAEILKLDLERSSVADKLQPSFGLTRLNFSFYDVLCEELAKSLLGKILVRHLDDGTVLKGRIVETECYLGGIDKASQSYNGKITERNIPMYMRPGTCYVYLTYGMYHCFNISSQGAGAAVLLRALEPLEGLDYMQEQRQKKRKPLQSSDLSEEKPSVKQNKLLKPHELCNGPAKLCMCLSISKSSCNKQDLCGWDGMWVETDEQSEVKPHHIVSSSRIGIDSVGIEWASKPLRFYLFGNKCVSRLDKKKEQEMQQLYGLSLSS